MFSVRSVGILRVEAGAGGAGGRAGERTLGAGSLVRTHGVQRAGTERHQYIGMGRGGAPLGAGALVR